VRKGPRLGATSLIVACLSFAALSVVVFFTLESLLERSRLEARNDMEHTMNTLLASLRDHADFGSAIEDSDRLKTKVIGVGVYAKGGAQLYSWGKAPRAFTAASRQLEGPQNAERGYIEKSENDSIVLLLLPMRAIPPPPGEKGPPDGKVPPSMGPSAFGDRGPAGARHFEAPRDPPSLALGPPLQSEHAFFFQTLGKGDVVYLEILERGFWRTKRFLDALFPLIEVLLAALIVFMRTLIVRNAEYRKRIEEQKSLVILGTAASTLAHEVKNPLLAIRLQTSILERTCPDAGEEIGIINDEVERISALCFRVNDYLRDPAGERISIDPEEIAREVGKRLCGRDILDAKFDPGRARPRIAIDPARLNSILENVLRNALESGSPELEVSIEMGVAEGGLYLDILDRGRGIRKADRDRLFDPFFTTKSRGSGIGLSICKRFVLAAKGTIALDEREGGGTRVRISFPLAQD
jgi:two-component system, NtrC family, sensor histidine kinase HydH